MLASKSRRSQLRQKVHLSLHYHERTVSALVWQEAVDEVESLYPRPSRSPPMKIQRRWNSRAAHYNFPCQHASASRSEKVNTIDDSNRDIFSMRFLSRGHAKSCTTVSLRLPHLASSHLEIETLLVSPIDNIVMTEIVLDCYPAKCSCPVLILPYPFFFSARVIARAIESQAGLFPFFFSSSS